MFQSRPVELSSESKACRKLLKAIDGRLKRGDPRGIILSELLRINYGKLDLETLQACSKAKSQLMDVMVDRNIEGKELEKEGKIDQAIELYEANVLDRFDGSHPYERLRIHYTFACRYFDAIRVCEKYLRNTSPHQREKALPIYERHILKLKSDLA